MSACGHTAAGRVATMKPEAWSGGPQIQRRYGGTMFQRRSLILALSLLVVTSLSLRQTAVTSTGTTVAIQSRVIHDYGKLPLHFEANRGQSASQVKFLSRGAGHALFLASTETVLVLRKLDEEDPKTAQTVVRMTFSRAKPNAQVSGQDELPGKSNYFIGNDPRNWKTDVPTYAKVRYEDLYPGIDVVYYGNQRQLEYDFLVAPGADPNSIGLGFQGADKLEVDAQADLVIHTAAGPVRMQKPFVYQDYGGSRHEISGGYALRNENEVGFELGAYDATRPLIIDPVLVYSSFLGGGAVDFGRGMAVDAAGNAYVAGYSSSANFPTTGGAFQTTYVGGSFDSFVAKLNPSGTGLVYSTYVGGTGLDQAGGIAVDTMGNAYAIGATGSSNFPTTGGAFDTTYGGGFSDAFVVKLNAMGSALVYSSYLGGSGQDVLERIAVDAGGNAYVIGLTNSGNFPTTPGSFQITNAGGAYDGVVTKVNAAGSALVYSTYLGGSGQDQGANIAVDFAGNAFVTGYTDSGNFPTTVGAFQTISPAPPNAFVTKVNPAGTALVYSTYLGGSGADAGNGIAVDTGGNVYVVGVAGSGTFPSTPGAFQITSSGGDDAFVTKLNALGSALVYSTYLGGSGTDSGQLIAVDTTGNAYIAGRTNSPNFPTATPFQAANAGSFDAFVTKLNLLGNALVYSSYLGGGGTDESFGIALDSSPNPNVYVAGHTASTNFPTTVGAFQTTFGGGSDDAFVVKIGDISTTIGKMYWTNSGLSEIERANRDGSNVEDILATPSPVAIAIDPVAGKMYWTDQVEDNIQRANLNGTTVETLVTGLVDPLGIALDVPGGKMYWIDESAQRIRRADLNGTNAQTLVTGLGDPRYIALDPVGSKMYWTDAGTDRIQRANLDGTMIETLVTGLVGPFGIALDLANGKMYWTENSDNKIQRANLNGTTVEDLITGLSGPVGIALDLGAGKMYWTEIATPRIRRANLSGTGLENLVTTGLSGPHGIALVEIADTAPTPATLTLTPAAATNPAGTPHCVTATVRDAFNNPVPSITVRFSVTGANSASGTAVTNAGGQATFCYTGTNAGADTITAFADTNNNSVQDTGEPSGIATKTYVAAAPATLTLAPATATNPAGTPHCVTAMVRDAFNNPTPGITVRFSVTGANSASGTAVTNTGGQAPFCYTGTNAGVDTITAFADTNNNAVQDTGEPSGTATKLYLPESPASLVLTPATASNTVDTQHCVTATVRDAFGNPVPGVTVRFTVAGSVNTSGSATTNSSGNATFCYQGPPLPGADAITAFADTDNDNTQDTGEPSGAATKAWVLPVTTPLCEVKITNGGWITAANGDHSTFGGNAKSSATGQTEGQEQYQDHGPAQPMNVHSIDVQAIVCDGTTSASIFGQATIDGVGSYYYRIRVQDLGEPGTGDTYEILLQNGYNSGEQVLGGGNVQIKRE
jgi:hypothetical protein